jgi:hypothetical protein
MSKLRIIGLSIILLGISMFILGVSGFSYQGKGLNPINSDLGMISFILWLPAVVVGIIMMRSGRKSRGK